MPRAFSTSAVLFFFLLSGPSLPTRRPTVASTDTRLEAPGFLAKLNLTRRHLWQAATSICSTMVVARRSRRVLLALPHDKRAPGVLRISPLVPLARLGLRELGCSQPLRKNNEFSTFGGAGFTVDFSMRRSNKHFQRSTQLEGLY